MNYLNGRASSDSRYQAGKNGQRSMAVHDPWVRMFIGLKRVRASAFVT